jgi:hypothetical protein
MKTLSKVLRHVSAEEKFRVSRFARRGRTRLWRLSTHAARNKIVRCSRQGYKSAFTALQFKIYLNLAKVPAAYERFQNVWRTQCSYWSHTSTCANACSQLN